MDFDDFINQFDRKYYQELSENITSNFSDSNFIPVEQLATYSAYVSQATTLHFLRKYHEWLQQQND